MNKFLRRFASLALGFALVAGVGVLISQNNDSKAVSATETLAACCDLTDTTIKTSGYAKEQTVGTFKVYGGHNNSGGWNYYKFGQKKAKAADNPYITEGYVQSTLPITEDVTKVEVVLLASTSTKSTTTWSVDYSSTSNFSGASTVNKGTLDHKVAGSYYAQPESGTFGSSKYFRVNFHIENDSTTAGVLFVAKVNFYYDSVIARGEASIQGLNNKIIFVGDSATLTAGWNPLSSGATVSSYSYSSSDSTVLSFSGNTYTAVAPGIITITLNLTDSNSENYTVESDSIFVSNEYSFEIGDTVALYSSDVSKELTSINKSATTHYGVGTDYVGSPNGTYLLTVEQGNADGSLSFANDGNYLAWTSGNNLTTKTTKDDHGSWYVISYNSYSLIINAATISREIWWYNSSTSPRFACYEGKTPSTSNYNTVDLIKIEEAPVRGTLEIATEFGKTLKQNSTGSLAFNWTPADGTSTQISTYEWTSNKSDVISISGNTYTAVGAGKAVISISATDETGQLYSASTSEIEVVGVVSGAYEKVTSVKNGDVVTIVCETAESQLSEIKSGDGHFVYYSTSPASVFDLTLVANGSYFALETSENKYLSWNSSTKFALVDPSEATDNSYWSISFDENDNAIIENKADDGDDSHRRIEWSENSSKFACYKQNETLVQLYAPVLSYSQAAVNFAESLLDLECDASGSSMPSSSEWALLKTAFESSSLTDTDRTDLRKAAAIEHNPATTEVERVQAAMARYDYIIIKYNKNQGLTTQFPDFINRNPSAGRVISVTPIINSDNSLLMMVVIIYTAISIGAISALIIVRRKKHH